jgi:hypothetical protein
LADSARFCSGFELMNPTRKPAVWSMPSRSSSSSGLSSWDAERAHPQDALRTFGDGAATEGAFEVVDDSFCAHRRAGRSPLGRSLRESVLRLARENPHCGCKRIARELRGFGIGVSAVGAQAAARRRSAAGTEANALLVAMLSHRDAKFSHISEGCFGAKASR